MSAELKQRSTLTVRVEPALLTRFQVKCVQQRRSMSDVIRAFIEFYVEREEKKA